MGDSFSRKEEEKKKKLQANITRGEKMEEQIEKDLQDKRDKKLEHERRLVQIEEDARRYQEETIAKNITFIKDAVTEAKTVHVDRNIQKKKAEAEKEQKRIDEFRQNNQ